MPHWRAACPSVCAADGHTISTPIQRHSHRGTAVKDTAPLPFPYQRPISQNTHTKQKKILKSIYTQKEKKIRQKTIGS